MFRLLVRGSLFVQVFIAFMLVVTGYLVLSDMIGPPLPNEVMAANPSHPDSEEASSSYDESPSDRRKHIRQHVSSVVRALNKTHDVNVGGRLRSALKGRDPDAFLQEAIMETCPISLSITRAHLPVCAAASRADGTSWDSFQSFLRSELRLGDEARQNAMRLLEQNDKATYDRQHGYFMNFAVPLESWPAARGLSIRRALTDVFGIVIRPPYHPFTRGISLPERMWLDCSWDSMTKVHQSLWGKMGWSAAKWDADESAAVTVESDKDVGKLAPFEQVAAWCLGYTATTW